MENDIDPRSFVTTPRWAGSILLNVGLLREEGFRVGYSPQPENPFHGEVWGEFNRSQVEALRHAARWFVEIPEVGLV
jgi:hypothetical protein